MRILGIDLALNHTGAVLLVDGKLSQYWYWTASSKLAKLSKRGVKLTVPHQIKKDMHLRNLWRLEFIRKNLKKIIKEAKPHYAGLEDYAVGKSQGAHYLGEAGCLLRLSLAHARIPFRAYDPHSLKMFATGSGNAPKEIVEPKVSQRWGVSFEKFRGEIKKSKTKEVVKDCEISADLADAFVAAKLAETEVLLRQGKINLSDLLDDKQRQVFLRTTKTYPINILGRGWISLKSLSIEPKKRNPK